MFESAGIDLVMTGGPVHTNSVKKRSAFSFKLTSADSVWTKPERKEFFPERASCSGATRFKRFQNCQSCITLTKNGAGTK